MSRLATAFVLGYHGCDETVVEQVVNSRGEHLRPSTKKFDWLGSGVYFWEADPRRALEWAVNRSGKRRLKNPAVVGAVIDLRNCLDLTVREDVDLLRSYYNRFVEETRLAELPLPENQARNDADEELMFRYRDCAVINYMHQEMTKAVNEALTHGRRASADPFDTVRGLFQEGGPAFDGAGVRAQSHTQIAVINTDCIRGYFRPRPYPAMEAP